MATPIWVQIHRKVTQQFSLVWQRRLSCARFLFQLEKCKIGLKMFFLSEKVFFFNNKGKVSV